MMREDQDAGALTGKRILLLEDEFFVAILAKEMLDNLGATVIGPVGKIGAGIALAQQEKLDAAVLDININNERSDAVADILERRGIPFILATGYGDMKAGQGVPVVDKPYTEAKLAEALRQALSCA